ncbi:hypothetical protein [Sporichthya sp.]|uniref:hypothetical protein n=1 Tax=Sporichthya sp. TaxID=65475 RepID=UPI001835DB30|nr:hypothetical protein [Sporichthya sp.]MBA3742597.1 hypothetical protein [Sporichthya sp.]
MASVEDKLVRAARQFIEPGEDVQTVFVAQTFWPPLFALIGIFSMLGGGYRLVVVTSQRILVLKTNWSSYRHPKSVLAELPRKTRLGPVSGPFAAIDVLGQRNYVVAGTRNNVAVADSFVGAH